MNQLEQALTVRNRSHHRAADPIPDDLHAGPDIKGAARRCAMRI